MDGNSLNESISLLELLHLSQYQDKFVGKRISLMRSVPKRYKLLYYV